MDTQRRTVAAVALAALLLSSGCIGFLVGSEPAEFSASKATASDAALSETGYEERSVTDETINESFSVGGQERQVTVTNWVAQYDRSVSIGPIAEQDLAVFAVFSTPKVDVLGQTFNPVGRLSNAELVKQVQSQYSSLSGVRQVDSSNVTVLGTETEVSKFAATTTVNGMEVDVYVHLTKVEHEGDYVIALAVYPQKLDGEAERVSTLFESVEHAE